MGEGMRAGSRLALALALLTPPAIFAEVEIPRSDERDRGKYYLIVSKPSGDVIQTLHKRVGRNGIVYTKTEIDCPAGKVRELSFGEVPTQLEDRPGEWFTPKAGSIKGDLMAFVCSRSN